MPVNKIIQDFNQKYYEPIKRWKVESSHRNPDTSEIIYYDIELWGDGEIVCYCLAGSFKHKCHHKKDKEAELCQQFGSIEKAINYYKNERNKLAEKRSS